MIRAVRGAPGGKFIVTPVHRFVLVAHRIDGVTKWFVGGVVPADFRAVVEVAGSLTVDIRDVAPGDDYLGPRTTANGTYKVRAREGGIVERSFGRTREVARADGAAQSARANLASLLRAWRATKCSGMEFYVNELWDAWYREGGSAKFLARIRDGFAWMSPTDIA